MKRAGAVAPRRRSVQPHVKNIEFGASPPKTTSPNRAAHQPRRRRHDPSALIASTESTVTYEASVTLGDAFPAGCDRRGDPLPVRAAEEWGFTIDRLSELMGANIANAERERIQLLQDALQVAVDGWTDYTKLREEVTKHLKKEGQQLGQVDKVRFDEELRHWEERQRDTPSVAARTAVRELDPNAVARTLVRGRRRGFGAEEKLSDELRRWQARLAWDTPAHNELTSPTSVCSSVVFDNSGSLATRDRNRRQSESSPCAPDWYDAGIGGGDTFFMSSLADEMGEVTVTGDRTNFANTGASRSRDGDDDTDSIFPPLACSSQTPRSLTDTFVSAKSALRTPAFNAAPEGFGRSWGAQSDVGSALSTIDERPASQRPPSPACSCPSPRVTNNRAKAPVMRPATASVARVEVSPPTLPRIETFFAVAQQQQRDQAPAGGYAPVTRGVAQRGAVSSSEVSLSLATEAVVSPRGCDLETDLRKMLGRGAHGEVYRARLRRADGSSSEVAVKRVRVTDRRTRALILRELDLWRRVGTSPHVVQYFCHRYHRTDRTYSIAMELCRYGSMQDLVNRFAWGAWPPPWRVDGILDRELLDELYHSGGSCGTSETGTALHKQSTGFSCQVSNLSPGSRRSGPGSARMEHPRCLPEVTVRRMMAHVVRGLAFVHSMNVIHRDIKPSNILLADDGGVKLCDFGVSAQLRSGSSMRHTMVGTLGFLAPEVIQEQPYTTAADMWSLGCTVMEALTGRRPYQDLPPAAALFRTVQDSECPLPASASEHISSDAVDFIHACLKKEAELRPSSKDAINHRFVNREPEPLIE
eukprot:Hpha_TRINITY_DN26067_c0_g1::TRINITY_DN26067_c0_g1_i1::g.115124::m.115124